MTGDRGRRGQALAELGIIIVLLVFLVMGIIEFGRAWMIVNMITQAARHGARAAAVLPLSKRNATTHVITDSSAIVTQVQNQIQNVYAGALDVTVNPQADAGGESRAISYTHAAGGLTPSRGLRYVEGP